MPDRAPAPGHRPGIRTPRALDDGRRRCFAEAVTLFLIFVALITFSVLFAWWAGGGPERVVGTMYLAAWIASITFKPIDYVPYHAVSLRIFVIDVVLLAGLLFVARRADRTWPVLAASLQVLVVLAHVARLLTPHQSPFVYMLMTGSWPMIQMTLLCVATALHLRRRLAGSPRASWVANEPGAVAVSAR